MAKTPIRVDTSILTEDDKKAALERQRRIIADEWAKAELGMAPGANLLTPKGPPPGLVEEQCPITLNLYPGSARIVIDGAIYLHGHTYTVGKSVYDLLCEIISRGWGHQREIEGKDSNMYREQQNLNAITGQPTRLLPTMDKTLASRLG